MAPQRTQKRTIHASSDLMYKQRLQAAIQGLSDGLYKTLVEAAREQNVCQFQITEL